MKKLLLFFTPLIILFMSLSITSSATKVNVDLNNNDSNLLLTTDAKSAVLLEPSTMEVIYEKDPYLKLAPASMTKIMTMILVMEALENNVIKYDQLLLTSKRASNVEGTRIFLDVGEQMSVDDLLKSLAIASANDAAIVFAEAIGGSVENFVYLMNKKANEIGLTNTNFKNPHGLPEKDHYSCSMDMAIMSAYLINNYDNKILKYTSLYEDYIRQDTNNKFWLVNRNKLVKFVSGVDGLKTGWTSEAGYCLSATMKKNGLRFISVTMGNSTPELRSKENLNLLNYGINNYEIITIYNKNDIIKTCEKSNLIPKVYNIVVSNDINILKKKNIEAPKTNVEIIINYENIDGVNNNDIGIIKIFANGKLLKEEKLILLEDVKKATYLNIFIEVLKELFLIAK